MAVLHQATLSPTKLAIVTDYLADGLAVVPEEATSVAPGDAVAVHLVGL